jgi:hypothetical protein
MLIAFQLSTHATDLAYALVVAVIYLGILRLVDLNEKEPLWAIGLLFTYGAAAAVLVHLLLGSPLLRLGVWPPAIAEETARLVAILGGAAVLGVVSQMRGWREIGGAMDGIVYGAAAGLGFATARIAIDRMILADALGPGFAAGPATIVTTALMELRDGVFGALIGAGVGAASGTTSILKRKALPLAGWIAAVATHAAYLALARGSAGIAAQARLWIVLFLPAIALLAVMAVALRQEKRAIRDYLAAAGATDAVEFSRLRSPTVRAARSWSALVTGDYERGAGERTLHNRLVQLALVRQRAAREHDALLRHSLEREATRLRESVAAIREALELNTASVKETV